METGDPRALFCVHKNTFIAIPDKQWVRFINYNLNLYEFY